MTTLRTLTDERDIARGLARFARLLDRWERRPQGWRIVRRDAVWHMRMGGPAVRGMNAAEEQ